MSHVDETVLTALVDDELELDHAASVKRHVSTCRECAAQLEEIQRLRDRAGAILGMATPQPLDIPPFDQVRRRASTTQQHKAARLSTLQRLAWAATIVLAVGIGWYVRGRVSLQPSAAIPPVEREADVGMVSAQTELQRPEEAAPEPTAAAPAPDPMRDAPAGRRETEARADVAQAPAPTVTVERAPAKERPIAAEQFAGAPAETDSVARAFSTREPALKAVAAASATADSVTAFPGATESWVPADAEAAEAFLGTRIAVVDGLPVLAYEVRSSEGNRKLARVTQRLSPDQTVTVSQERYADPGVQSAAERLRNVMAARAAPTSLTERRGEFVITLSAELSADSLRQLFRKIR